MTSPLREGETLSIGIFVHDQVEELDFCGPYETFTAASRQAARLGTLDYDPLTVFTVAERTGLVRASHGLRVQPDYSFADHPPIDIVLVPGGNTRPQLENPAVVEWLTKVTARARVNTSVCTGAFLLGKVGLLDGHRATTHWGSLDRLAEAHPAVTVQREVRWVDEGAVITSAGISAGIDMSLHLVERLLGREVAEATARYMEYRWNEN